jgi:hypothetical protein
MGTLIFFPMTSKVWVKILYPSRFIILHLRFNTSMIKYGYVINWYQRKGSNIKQVWDREQSNFDKFVVANFFSTINLGKTI